MSDRTRLWLGAACVVGLSLCGAGCLDRPLAPVDPRTQTGVFVEIHQTGTTKLDMLFVVDNSNSMQEEQGILSDQIEVMVQELISPTPDPETGRVPPAVEDLHIGIVTTDMGTGGYTVMTCQNPLQGDNGVLQNRDRGILEGCQATYSAADCSRAECPWLVHSGALPDDDPTNDPIWEDFGCIATLGTGGCGFEQQLESSLVALTVQALPGNPNEGFLRGDSLIAVVYVTDEDDCSTGEPEMFNPSRNADLGPLNVRCALHPEMNYALDRYYEGFRSLRPDNEDLVVIAAITGVPIDGSWEPGDPIEELRALQRIDPSDPNRLLPSCQTAMGLAFPPVRLAELIYMFGNNGILESICRSDWTAALVAITRKIQSKLTGACMSRQLASTDPDVCRVIETLFDSGPCPSPTEPPGAEQERTSGWHIDLGLDEEGRRQCEIQAADYDGDACPDSGGGTCECGGDSPNYSGCLQGWFYEPGGSGGGECPSGQVRFTSDQVTAALSDVRFECSTALCPERQQVPANTVQNLPGCDPVSPDCGNDQICVRHNSTQVCGGEPTCGRCSPRVGQVCSYIQEHNPYWAGEELVGAGGCCHEGFHFDPESNDCQPNRTTRCD